MNNEIDMVLDEQSVESNDEVSEQALFHDYIDSGSDKPHPVIQSILEWRRKKVPSSPEGFKIFVWNSEFKQFNDIKFSERPLSFKEFIKKYTAYSMFNMNNKNVAIAFVDPETEFSAINSLRRSMNLTIEPLTLI